MWWQPLCVAGPGQPALQFQVRRGSAFPLLVAEPTTTYLHRSTVNSVLWPLQMGQLL